MPPQPTEPDFRRIFPQGIAGCPRGSPDPRHPSGDDAAADSKAAASWLARHGLGVSPDRIVLTSGAQSALFAVCGLLLARGDVLLIRPLVAHNSLCSQPGNQDHRRILHLEFAAGRKLPDGYEWHDFLSTTDPPGA